MLRFMLDEQTVANAHCRPFSPPPPPILLGKPLYYRSLGCRNFSRAHMGGEAAGQPPEAQGTLDRKGKLLVSGATVKVTGLKGAPQHNGGSTPLPAPHTHKLKRTFYNSVGVCLWVCGATYTHTHVCETLNLYMRITCTRRIRMHTLCESGLDVQ